VENARSSGRQPGRFGPPCKESSMTTEALLPADSHGVRELGKTIVFPAIAEIVAKIADPSESDRLQPGRPHLCVCQGLS
jgi:hypothetical protein